jgi:predicted DNA-binding transcriptional regulator AlpA
METALVAAEEMPRLYRLEDLESFSTLKRTAIYEEVKAGRLAKPLKIRGGRSAWRADDVRAWLARLGERPA